MWASLVVTTIIDGGVLIAGPIGLAVLTLSLVLGVVMPLSTAIKLRTDALRRGAGQVPARDGLDTHGTG